MGEVYRARDSRLGREVAIKVLPASFSADPDRLRRFEQEARAAGILNHPNITAVYDIGSDEAGEPYVVSELLEGETLRGALAGGKLSPRRAVDYALQIAHGLAAAHEKGIVHRDLKPENLFVTKDGRVKILDFGLAKLTHQEEGSQATNLPTATAGTEPGVVLGTLGYMSPEQVRGRPADARSDIFSFGAILYEMLSGNRAFHGDSAADTMSAILKEDPPDLSLTNQNVSPGLERIIRHCLEKNPEQRFHSAHDVAFALEALTGVSSPSGLSLPARRTTRRFAPLLALAAALAAGLAAGHFLRRPQAPPVPTFKRLTFRRGNISTARFAPDGQSVVYGAAWEGRPIEIYSTRLDSPESTPLGFPSIDLLSVSSSGELAVSIRERFLVGVGTGTLARAPLGGGAPRPITEFVEEADWAPDGKEVAITRFFEGRNRLEYPIGRVLSVGPRGFRSIRFSPRGDRIAFVERAVGGTYVRVVDLAGKVQTLAGPDLQVRRLAWSPSGDEIWLTVDGSRGDNSIEAVSLSGRRRVLLRVPAFLLVHDLSRDGRLLAERSSNLTDLLCQAPGAARERELSWFDGSAAVALSDDGKQLLFNENGDAASKDGAFFVRRTDGSPAVKLGDGDAYDFSPDGKWVLARRREPTAGLLLVPTGTGSPRPIDRADFTIRTAALFPDGKRVLVLAHRPGQDRLVYVQEIPSGKPRALPGKGFSWRGQPISPDGKTIVVIRDWTEDLFLLPVDGGQPRTIPDTKSLDPIRWSADGRFLYAAEAGKIPIRILRIDVATGRREEWKELVPAQGAAAYDSNKIVLTPDAKAYAYGFSRASTSDLYLVEGLR
jgi:eukaryotic-like serine/threonine-protein kinase